MHIISLGCSKNLIDSEVMGGQAAVSGMTLVESPDQADIVVINTCGFIIPAKEEALEIILTLAKEKTKSGRDQKLIVAGCPQAFLIGERFIDEDSVCMILGDNIFEDDFSDDIKNFKGGAKVFAKRVPDPHRFGVVEFDENNKAISIEEKPEKPKSNY